MELSEMIEYVKKTYSNTKKNAAARKIQFNVTIEDVVNAFIRSGGKCELIGKEFSVDNNKKRQPWAPSIDRINNDKGYTKDNIRIVCVITNYALNEFGDEVFYEFVHNAAVKMKLTNTIYVKQQYNKNEIDAALIEIDNKIKQINEKIEPMEKLDKKQRDTKEKSIFMYRDEVIKKIGMAYTTIWRMEKNGDFPSRVRLSVGRVAWKTEEIEQWINARQNPGQALFKPQLRAPTQKVTSPGPTS